MGLEAYQKEISAGDIVLTFWALRARLLLILEEIRTNPIELNRLNKKSFAPPSENNFQVCTCIKKCNIFQVNVSTRAPFLGYSHV